MQNKTLFISATTKEVEPLLKQFKLLTATPLKIFELKEYSAHLLISGIGQYNTLVNLSRYINDFGAPSEIISLGISGSFHSKFHPNSICKVLCDIPADQIKEAQNEWLTHHDAGLPETSRFENQATAPSWYNRINLPEAKAITTDFLTDNQFIINKRKSFFNADIESMEGSAVFFMANTYNIPAVQFRAISNYVGETNKSQWKLPEAILLLCNFAHDTIFPILNKT